VRICPVRAAIPGVTKELAFNLIFRFLELFFASEWQTNTKVQ
jgi:hypothetical protein